MTPYTELSLIITYPTGRVQLIRQVPALRLLPAGTLISVCLDGLEDDQTVESLIYDPEEDMAFVKLRPVAWVSGEADLLALMVQAESVGWSTFAFNAHLQARFMAALRAA